MHGCSTETVSERFMQTTFVSVLQITNSISGEKKSGISSSVVQLIKGMSAGDVLLSTPATVDDLKCKKAEREQDVFPGALLLPLLRCTKRKLFQSFVLFVRC